MTIELSSALDVAIGVVFLLLVLSMVVSITNEFIAKIFSWRSENLKEGINNLLSDPDAQALAKLVYQHPLIQSLGRQNKGGKPANPSYIPSKRFAQALIETIKQSASDTASSHGATRSGLILERGGARSTEALTRTSNPEVGEASRTGDSGIAIPNVGKTLTDIRSVVAALPDSGARSSLLVLADRAKGNLDVFERNVAEWFDDGMDRVSGWYKRKVQTCMFLIALTVAVVLNVDVLNVAQSLRQHPELREDFVTLAQEFHENAGGDVEQTDEAVESAINQFASMTKLPLGWTKENLNAAALWSIPGWLLTAMLASLGAPFWFNVLGHLLDIRGSGNPPPKTRGNGSGANDAAPNTSS